MDFWYLKNVLLPKIIRFLLMKVYCLTSDEVSSTWNANRDTAEQYTQDMWVRSFYTYSRGACQSLVAFFTFGWVLKIPLCLSLSNMNTIQFCLCYYLDIWFVCDVALMHWCWDLKLQTPETDGTVLSSPSWKMTRCHMKPSLMHFSKEKHPHLTSLLRV